MRRDEIGMALRERQGVGVTFDRGDCSIVEGPLHIVGNHEVSASRTVRFALPMRKMKPSAFTARVFMRAPLRPSNRRLLVHAMSQPAPPRSGSRTVNGPEERMARLPGALSSSAGSVHPSRPGDVCRKLTWCALRQSGAPANSRSCLDTPALQGLSAQAPVAGPVNPVPIVPSMCPETTNAGGWEQRLFRDRPGISNEVRGPSSNVGRRLAGRKAHPYWYASRSGLPLYVRLR